MLTCEKCQTKNLEGSQYCDECGGALSGGGVSLQSRGAASSAVSEGHGEMPRVKPVERRAASGDAAENGASADKRTDTQSGGGGGGRRLESATSSAGGSASGQFVFQSSPETLQSGPHAKLVIHRGRSAGKEFLLDEDESHIGRWDADGGIFPDVDLDADDPEAKVSRRHARITRRGGQYFVEDMGSTNGTFINRGRRLLPGDRQALHDGDEVIVGKTFLRFQILK